MKLSAETGLITLTEARLSGRLMRGRDERIYSLGDSTPVTSRRVVNDLTRRGWLEENGNGWRITRRGLAAECRLLRRRRSA
jgi:hypothetical protein